MQSLTKALSNLSLYPRDQLPRSVAQSAVSNVSELAEELLLRIFSHLHHGSFLTAALLTCKSWCKIAKDPSLWEDIVIRAHSHEARVVYLLAKLQGVKPDWQKVAVRQNHTIQRLLTSRFKVIKSSLPTDFLAHAPFAKRTFVDIDGQLYVTDPTTLRFFQIQHANKKECYSLEKIVDQQFQKATLSFCSIRHTRNGKIALMKLEHDGRAKLIAYHLQNRCLSWQGAVGETPVFPGSLNLGIGYVQPPEMPRWNEKIAQERQELSIEPLSPLFFTASQEAGKTTIGIYDLTSKNPFRATLPFLPDQTVKHIDSDRKATMLVITKQTANEALSHTLAGLRSDGTYLKHSNLQVLAFDPFLSVAVICSRKEMNRLKPIFLAQYSKEDGTRPIRYYNLPIPPKAQYKAQIKGKHVAILAEGPESRDLYVIPLFQKNRPLLTKVVIEHIHNYTIRSFTLLEELLLITTNIGLNRPGPVVLYDLKSYSVFTHIPEEITRVLGREGHLLICQTPKECLTLDLRNGSTKKLFDGKSPSSYLSGFFCQENHKPLCYHEYY